MVSAAVVASSDTSQPSTVGTSSIRFAVTAGHAPSRATSSAHSWARRAYSRGERTVQNRQAEPASLSFRDEGTRRDEWAPGPTPTHCRLRQ